MRGVEPRAREERRVHPVVEEAEKDKALLTQFLVDRALASDDKRLGMFYYVAAAHLRRLPVEYGGPQTILATDGEKFYVGDLYPAAKRKYGPRILAFMWLHEVLHILHAHPARIRAVDDPELYNIIADLYVNELLRNRVGDIPNEFVTLSSFIEFILREIGAELDPESIAALKMLAEHVVSESVTVEQAYAVISRIPRAKQLILDSFRSSRFFGSDLPHPAVPTGGGGQGADQGDSSDQGGGGGAGGGVEGEETGEDQNVIRDPGRPGGTGRPLPNPRTGEGQGKGRQSNERGGVSGAGGATGRQAGPETGAGGGRGGREEEQKPEGSGAGQRESEEGQDTGEAGGAGEQEEHGGPRGAGSEKRGRRGARRGGSKADADVERLKRLLEELRRQVEKTLAETRRAIGEYKALRRHLRPEDVEGGAPPGTEEGVFGVAEYEELQRLRIRLERALLREVGRLVREYEVNFASFDRDAYWLPEDRELLKSKIKVFLDTSGSIPRPAVKLFMHWVNEAVRKYGVEADVAVFAVEVIGKEKVSRKLRSSPLGGGTVWEETVAEEILRSVKEEVPLLIVLSDFWIEVRDEAAEAIRVFKRRGGKISCWSIAGFADWCDYKHRLPDLLKVAR